jgi:predicted O-methyltransferase YrrM
MGGGDGGDDGDHDDGAKAGAFSHLACAKLNDSSRGISPTTEPPHVCHACAQVKGLNAKRVLEIGTFTGYSALCLAEGVGEGGRVITCDIDPRCLDIARRFAARSPHGNKVDICQEAGRDLLQRLVAAGEGPFDVIFLDGDKRSYRDYYDVITRNRLLAPTGVLVADNVLWKGLVLEVAKEQANGGTGALSEVRSQAGRWSHRLMMKLVAAGQGLVQQRGVSP